MRKLLLFLSFIAFLLFVPKSAMAATLHLSPGSVNTSVGATTSVSVRLNTGGEPINGVSAYLSYPADKLEVTSIAYGSAFSIAAEGSYGGGGIRISRGSFNGVTGTPTVATLRFRAKAEGKATVVFIGGSGAARASNSTDALNLGGSSGATFNIGKASALPSKAPSTSAPSGQQQQPSGLVISNLKVVSESTNSAVITWETSQAADSQVEFGIEAGKYLVFVPNSTQVTHHSIKLDKSELSPGLLLYLRARSKNSDDEAVSEEVTLQIRGYKLKVKVTDSAGRVLRDTDLWLYSQPQQTKTNSFGEAEFVDVRPGNHLLLVKDGQFEKTFPIEVGTDRIEQSFDFQIERPTKSFALSLPPLGSVGVLLAATLLVLLLSSVIVMVLRKRQRHS